MEASDRCCQQDMFYLFSMHVIILNPQVKYSLSLVVILMNIFAFQYGCAPTSTSCYGLNALNCFLFTHLMEASDRCCQQDMFYLFSIMSLTLIDKWQMVSSVQSWQVWHQKDRNMMLSNMMPKWMICKFLIWNSGCIAIVILIGIYNWLSCMCWQRCRLANDGQDFFTMYEEVFETFDSMGLQENLLRGIYAYGRYWLASYLHMFIHLAS